MDALVTLLRSFRFHHQRNLFPRYLRPRRFDPCFRFCAMLSQLLFLGCICPLSIRSRCASIADAYVRVCHVPHKAQVNAQSTVFSAAFEAHEAPVGDRRPLWVLLLAVAAHAVVRLRLQRTKALRSLGRRHVVPVLTTSHTHWKKRPRCTWATAPPSDQGCRCTTHTPSFHLTPSLTPSETLSCTLRHPPSPTHTLTLALSVSNVSITHSHSSTRTRVLGQSQGQASSHMHARTTHIHEGTEGHTRTHVRVSLLCSSCSPPSRSPLLTHDFSTLACLSFVTPTSARLTRPLTLDVVLSHLATAPSWSFAFTWKHGLERFPCFRLQGRPSRNTPLFHTCPPLSRRRCLSISNSRKSSLSRSLSLGDNAPLVLEMSNSRPFGSVHIGLLSLLVSNQSQGTRLCKFVAHEG